MIGVGQESRPLAGTSSPAGRHLVARRWPPVTLTILFVCGGV
jgi:hypothetical protein